MTQWGPRGLYFIIMKPHVKLLTKPDIDIGLFLSTVQKAIGFNPAAPIDRGTKKFSDYEKFIACLSSFHDNMATERPTDAIRRSGSLCAHLHFSFLVAATPKTILKSAERTRLRHTVTEQLDELALAVVSGDLGQWVEATIECTAEDIDFNLRLLYDTIFLQFRKLKLAQFWWNTTTQKNGDGTFRIEHKK